MARKKSFDHPISLESCWVRYQLDLRKIKYEAIAQKAHCSAAFVSMVISRQRTSGNVEAALAECLGYSSWKHLWGAAFINTITRQEKNPTKEKEEQKRNFPLTGMSHKEILELKGWMNNQIKEKKATLGNSGQITNRLAESFLGHEEKIHIHKSTLQLIGRALGHDSIEEMLAAYWEKKEGAA